MLLKRRFFGIKNVSGWFEPRWWTSFQREEGGQKKENAGYVSPALPGTRHYSSCNCCYTPPTLFSFSFWFSLASHEGFSFHSLNRSHKQLLSVWMKYTGARTHTLLFKSAGSIWFLKTLRKIKLHAHQRLHIFDEKYRGQKQYCEILLQFKTPFHLK